jgi:hypothetical protein
VTIKRGGRGFGHMSRTSGKPGDGGSIGGSPAVNTVAPSISGTRGGTLTATPGTWTGATSVTAQWYVNGTATGNTTTSYNDASTSTSAIEYRETAMPGSVTASAFANAVNGLMMGTVLTPPTYGNNTHMFVDLVPGTGNVDYINSGGSFVSGYPENLRDAQGFPSDAVPGMQQVRIVLDIPEAVETYVVTWDDPNGSMTSAGVGAAASFTTDLPNKKVTWTPSVIQPAAAGAYFYYMFNPALGHPTNIQCRPLADPGGLFNPSFKNKLIPTIASGGVLRLVQVTSVEDNSRPTNYSTLKFPVDGDGQLGDPIYTSANRNKGPWSTRLDGVSLENLVTLETQVGSNAHWCAPWNCDASYRSDAANQWAAFAAATGKKVYATVSNEVWNFGYTVSIQAINEADYRGTLADAKTACRVVATANITLSGTQTIDGVSVVAGDRVLVIGQTTASQNGVYVVAAGAWSRASDADATGEIQFNDKWFISAGTTNANRTFVCRTTGTITVGTTAITISRFIREDRYGEKLKELFDAFTTAFTAAGVADKLVRVAEWQNANSDMGVWDRIRAQAPTTDTISTAMYYGNNSSGQPLYNAGFTPSYAGTPQAVFDALGPDHDALFALFQNHVNYAATHGLGIMCYEAGPTWLWNNQAFMLSLIRDPGLEPVTMKFLQRIEAVAGQIPVCYYGFIGRVEGAPVPTSSWGLLEGSYQTVGTATPKYNGVTKYIAGKRVILAPTTTGLSVPQGSANGTVVGSVTWTQTGPTASLSNNALGAFALVSTGPTSANITVADSTKIASAGNQTIAVDLTWGVGTNSPLSTNFTVNVFAPFSVAMDFIAGTYNVSGTSYGSLAAVPGFTYSRSDTLTVLDSDGGIDTFAANVVPINGFGLHSYAATAKGNLLSSPSQFDNAIWGKSGTTVTADTDVAPDGTTSGDTVNATTTSGRINQGLAGGATTGAVYTASFFVKRGTATDVKLAIIDDSSVAYVGPTSYYSQINSGTWTRIVITFTCGSNGALLAPIFQSGVTGTTKLWFGQVMLGAFGCGGPIAPFFTATQACDLSFTAPNGTYSATYTFDDNSTQVVSHVVSDGKFHIDTAPTLNRGRIKSLAI